MSAILLLVWKSVCNRKFTVTLMVCVVAISIILLLGVEQIRTQTKHSFNNTISGTDLIVGARSGQVNLLLYSIFRIGNPTNNISWHSYKDISSHSAVAWSIPISLGDSHKGFPVVGTNLNYFKYFRYGQKQPLVFSQGREFNSVLEVVLGSDITAKLKYDLNSEIVLAHGMGDVAFTQHKNLPFKVVGILAPTGTPVDKSVHISLKAMEAIHIGWDSGMPLGQMVNVSDIQNYNLAPKQITAALIGLKSKFEIFQFQRQINNNPNEALVAILPGVALSELWSIMSIAEHALFVVTIFVVITAMLGILSSLLASLQERRREMAILRAVGAKPRHVFSLLIIEASSITFVGIIAGICGLNLVLMFAKPFIIAEFGIDINLLSFNFHQWLLLGCVQLLGSMIGLIPAFCAYQYSLSDGMKIRV